MIVAIERRVRRLAVSADRAAAAGPGYVWRRLRRRAVGATDRNALYEQIWHEAAESVGAESRVLSPGRLELRRGRACVTVFQQFVNLASPGGLEAALDKTAVHGMLAHAGLPVTAHREFHARRLGLGLRFLAEAPGPCVVKPAAGTGGGEGTTTGVRTPWDLLRASFAAGAATDRLLIEHQVPGAVYRLLFLDGELLDVVRHLPTRLIGDGRSTIATLIHAENERRLDAKGLETLYLLGVDLDTVLTLRAVGLTLRSVVPAGRAFAVTTVTNNSRREDRLTVRDGVCPEVVFAARAAAAALAGLRLAGVDVITPDIGRPLAEVSGVIAEVNSNPGLHHHYVVADEEGATRVAVPVLEVLLDEAA